MTMRFVGFILEVVNEVVNRSSVDDHDVALGRKNCFGG